VAVKQRSEFIIWVENMELDFSREGYMATLQSCWDTATHVAVKNFTAHNSESAQLCDCEQLYIGCAITGASCKTRGLSKCA
jgi:hypothetical protein